MNLSIASISFFIIFFSPQPNFLGVSYLWKHEFVNFTYIDKDIYSFIEAINFKQNKTVKAFNVTCKINWEISEDISSYIHIQGYQLRSNEYRRGPINFNIKTCTLIREGNFGAGMFMQNSNLTSCPIKKGYYHFHDIFFESGTLPRFVPAGHWKFVVQMFIKEIMAFEAVWFANIEN